MPTSNEYRQSAEECYRLAGGAETEADRLACLELARTWLEAASRRDEMTPEQIAEEEKLDNVRGSGCLKHKNIKLFRDGGTVCWDFRTDWNRDCWYSRSMKRCADPRARSKNCG